MQEHDFLMMHLEVKEVRAKSKELNLATCFVRKSEMKSDWSPLKAADESFIQLPSTVLILFYKRFCKGSFLVKM